MTPTPEHVARLTEIVTRTPWLWAALRAARAEALPGWVLAAGAIRGAVWADIHGFGRPRRPSDLDLVYFDAATAADPGRDRAAEARLNAVAPGVAWEVVNQAGVHREYPARFGHAVPPFPSLEAALMAWPETATAVGVRLEPDDTLTVVAPFGLADLFDLVLRPSPHCLDPDAFERRLIEKRLTEHWPRVRVARG